MKHQRDQLTSEVKTLKKEVDSLQKIYQEQDELLGESVWDSYQLLGAKDYKLFHPLWNKFAK